jgi:anti-sigma factor RsiW
MSGVELPGIGEHLAPDVLHDFLDGQLAARQAHKIEEHLRACSACTSEADAWISVLQRLDGIERFAPSEGFAARVMTDVVVPGHIPLAARIRGRVVGAFGASRPEHVPEGILQDFVDGTLPTRAVARVEAHLDQCAACTDELGAWQSVAARLETLEPMAPSPDLSARVMAEVRIQQAARELAPVSMWWRAGAAARRMVPQTREAWAALSGVAVTPAAIIGLMAWAVFSHPTLTLGSLASFAAWQVADLATSLFSGSSALVIQSLDAFGARALFQIVTGAPLVLAAVILTYTVLCVLASRVLYRNLFANRSLFGRYAHVSFAS